jgi:hypothetical protein
MARIVESMFVVIECLFESQARVDVSGKVARSKCRVVQLEEIERVAFKVAK